MNPLAQPLTLPCGVTIKNRIAKAAMTEGLADSRGVPTKQLERLYAVWSNGGAGLLLSGNIVIDSKHLERPGNVIVEQEPDQKMQQALTAMAKAGTQNGNHFWGQISHAGRQTQKAVNAHPKAPSAVKLGLPGGQFGEPVALIEEEIEDLIQGFVVCATALKQAGFSGVQIHAAHGYLISQFLSPKCNLRKDKYGGSLENRARVLIEVVKRVRQVVGARFPVAVKLNSADFQKGGFAFEDSVRVAKMLEHASVDLIEISGGSYEQPKLMGLEGIEPEETQNVAQSTRLREAYFVDFALAMQKEVSIPLMVTGGFRQRAVMEEAINIGAADIIGIGRPMCVDTDAPQQLLNGVVELNRYEKQISLLPNWLSFLTKINLLRTISGFAVQFWYYTQIVNIAENGKASTKLSVFSSMIAVSKHEKEWLTAHRQS